jgi:hypothetical protein
MSMYRSITGHYHGNICNAGVISDSELLDRYDAMNPSTPLRVARLLLLGRLAIKAPAELLTLLVDMGSSNLGWPASVRSDLKWLTISESFARCGGLDLAGWIRCILGKPKFFKQGVTKFARCKYANIYESKDPATIVPASASSYECNMCDSSFGTLQQFSLHMFKKHGVKIVTRL